MRMNFATFFIAMAALVVAVGGGLGEDGTLPTEALIAAVLLAAVAVVLVGIEAAPHVKKFVKKQWAKLPPVPLVERYRAWRYGESSVFAIYVEHEDKPRVWWCPYCRKSVHGELECPSCGGTYDAERSRVKKSRDDQEAA